MSKSRFKKQSHVLWHCQYHIIWVPKYPYKVLYGAVKKEVDSCIRLYVDKLGGEIVELNIQVDHVHLLGQFPPKHSISHIMGVLKVNQRHESLRSFLSLKFAPIGEITFGHRGIVLIQLG